MSEARVQDRRPSAVVVATSSALGLALDVQRPARVPVVLVAVGVRLINLAALQLLTGPLEVAVVGPQVLMRDYVRPTALIDLDDLHIDLHGLVTLALDYELSAVPEVQIRPVPVV